MRMVTPPTLPVRTHAGRVAGLVPRPRLGYAIDYVPVATTWPVHLGLVPELSTCACSKESHVHSYRLCLRL